MQDGKDGQKGQEWPLDTVLRALRALRLVRGPVGVAKILNIGISKMQPQIVVMLVLRTPKHLELSLKLQK